MFGERRKHNRQAISRSAKFMTELGPARDCTIVDISESGARIISDISVPDNFILIVSGDTPIKQECSVVWRLGVEVGVSFVTKEREEQRLKAMKDFEAEAREILHQN